MRTPKLWKMKMARPLVLALLACAALGLSGCGKSTSAADTAAATTAAPDVSPMEVDLAATLKKQADFYRFKTAADLAKDTQGLTWEDGSDLAPFADPAAKKGGTLTLWVPDFPGTFRSVGPDSNSSFREFLQDYTLFGFVRGYPNEPGRIYPELATSWAVDRATATVYFKLDPDAKWSDGTPFTTDDVVFSFYLFRSPLLNDPWINDYFTRNFTSLTVYDAHTFSATLHEVRPDIVARAGDPFSGMPPFPRKFFRDFDKDWVTKYNWRLMPTTGAYTIKEEDVKRMSSITMSHVKDWWGENKKFNVGRFNPDRVRLSVVRDTDKAFEAFVHGDLDVYSITNTLWYGKFSASNPSVQSGFSVRATFYHQIPPPNFALWLNESKAPLDNLDVRLGVQYATNFSLVCQQYFRGDATIQKTVSDGYGWDPAPDVQPRAFDPAKARGYFTKAGYTQQGPDGILMTPQGQRLSLTITTTYKQYQDILIILKQEALKAGLEFNIEVLDETTGWQKTQEKKHDIAFAAFNRTVDMYPRYWENYSGDNAYDVPYLADGSPNPARKIKESTNNLNEIANYKLDLLIKQYDKTETMDQVKVLAAKIEQGVYDDACWVNGWKLPFYRLGYRPWVHWPADFNPAQSLDFREFWEMWIDQDEEKADLAAKDAGKGLPVQDLTFDKHKGT
jgi:microcin C transport system substrate-binding protein